MTKEEIEGQLRLSKRQNKNERYDYLCSQFNCVNYAINLEKYTNNLQKENKKYKEVIDNIQKEINKIYVNGETINRALLLGIYENIYNVLKEVE